MAFPTLEYIDSVTPELKRIAAQLRNPVALYKDVGRRVANDLRAHYRKRQADNPNKLGGRRTNFWLDVRDSVQQPEAIPGGVEIAITHPAIAAKIFGARIVARNADALTIPLHALAHGRRARVFENETGKKLFRPKGKRVLMADFDGDVVPIYALAKSVAVPRDPLALPPKAEIESAIFATGRAHLARQLARI